jgi:hypothetical protein
MPAASRRQQGRRPLSRARPGVQNTGCFWWIDSRWSARCCCWWASPQEPAAVGTDFVVSGAMTAAELWEYYGVRIAAPGESTLDDVLRERLGGDCRPGEWIRVGGVRLQVRELDDGRIDRIAIAILAAGDDEAIGDA